MEKNQNQPKKSNSQERQSARISDREKELLRGIFQDNEDLLLAVRNLFFGFDLNEVEKEVIKNSFKTEESRKLMRKLLLPELQRDIPVGQSVDLWMTIDIQGKEAEQIRQITAARASLIQSMDAALRLLEDVNAKPVDLEVNEDTTDWQLIARNTFIQHVELQLQVIRTLANQEELTPEEAAEMLHKNSNK